MLSNRYPKVYCENTMMVCPVSFSGIPEGETSKFEYSLEAVIQKDSGKKSFGFSPNFLSMTVVDVDKVVVALGGQNDASMDCLIPIGNYDASDSSFSNHRWLTVELRLNSTVAKNDKYDLEKKVKHTAAMFSGGVLDKDKVFVYPDSCFARKKGLFVQWKRGSNKNMYENWLCLSPRLMQEYLLLKENIPYQPIYSLEDVLDSFKEPKDIDAVSGILNIWLAKAEGYKVKGNFSEYQNILGLLGTAFEKVVETVRNKEDKELLKMEWRFLLKYL